jgi:hypothetical protein
MAALMFSTCFVRESLPCADMPDALIAYCRPHSFLLPETSGFYQHLALEPSDLFHASQQLSLQKFRPCSRAEFTLFDIMQGRTSKRHMGR